MHVHVGKLFLLCLLHIHAVLLLNSSMSIYLLICNIYLHVSVEY